jgi:outer membrane receptor for ferrienterochelin and colicins
MGSTNADGPPRGHRAMRGRARRVLATAAWLLVAAQLDAQAPSTGQPMARVGVRVQHDERPVAGAIVRTLDLAPPVAGQTDAEGRVALQLPAGAHRVVVSRLGLRPDTLALLLRADQDTSVIVVLEEARAELGAVVVAATRGERRVDDTPLRVEVIDEEELGEKVAMSPGDIAMLLNETGGLRVQPTNPSLGGANVRVQGLRGRYTLLLADACRSTAGRPAGLACCRSRRSTWGAWRSSRGRRQRCTAARRSAA